VVERGQVARGDGVRQRTKSFNESILIAAAYTRVVVQEEVPSCLADYLSDTLLVRVVWEKYHLVE